MRLGRAARVRWGLVIFSFSGGRAPRDVGPISGSTSRRSQLQLGLRRQPQNGQPPYVSGFTLAIRPSSGMLLPCNCGMH